MKARIWILLHALVALLPVIGAVAQAPDVRLFGSEVPPALPQTWSLDAWRHEQLQPALQAWFEAHVGFRGVMVRTDNTVQAIAFRDSKPASVVLEGDEETLFINDDVHYMGTRSGDLPYVLSKVAALTERAAVVQRKLAARGKKLVIVIAPSKTAIYPEDVRPRWRRGKDDRADLVVHEALREGLERNGVKFVDGHTLLGSWRGESRELVFTRSGRHWTTLGACLVLRQALLDGPITPACTYAMEPGDRQESTDFDLYRLRNVWRFERAPHLLPLLTERGKAPEQAPGSAPRPRTLFIGSSFMWMLAEALRPLVESPRAFYYNQTVYDVSETLRPIEPVDADSPRWSGYVLDPDLYVLELLETYAHGEQMATFLETLDRRLD